MDYEEVDGKVMVEYSLKDDIVEPLRRIESKLDSHIDKHAELITNTLESYYKRRHDQWMRWFKTAGYILGAVVTALPIIAAVFSRL